MNSLIKRSIIIVSVIIVVGIFAYLFFLKSDYYLNQQAYSKRTEKLNELNSIKRLFAYEGVYIYRHSILKRNDDVNKFGNRIVGYNDDETIDIEFSFTSKKLAIMNNKQDVKEEILFKNEYIISSIKENSCSYKFFIDSWNLRHISNKELIKDISLTKECDKYITLEVSKDIPTSFHSYYGFRSITYDKNNLHLINLLFKGAGGNPVLIFHNLKQKYSDVYAPSYVELATYEDNIYKLDSYKVK